MSNHGDLPEQETLRRRLRAALLLSDLTLTDLAERIDRSEKLSARTLRKLTNAETEISVRALRPIAEALGIPLDWFLTQEPVWARYETAPSPAFEQRLAQLQAQIDELARRLPFEEEGELLSHPAEEEPPPAGRPSTQRRSKRPAPHGTRRSTAQ